MALATYPSVSSPVKSVQRGSAAGAGTVTITAIDISKAMVNIFGTTSSGTVSASFGLSSAGTGNFTMDVTAMSTSWNFGESQLPPGYTGYGSRPNPVGTNSQHHAYITRGVNAANYNVNAGSNNLVAAVVQGYLSNSTSLVVSGACRYEIVEFN